MSNTRIAIVLFIVFEIPAAWYAAQGAWRSRSQKTDKRTIVGMCAGVALAVYGFARLLALFTNIKYGRLLTDCLREIETRSLVQTIIQTVPAYILAFAFTADEHPGLLRRKLNWLISKAQ